MNNKTDKLTSLIHSNGLNALGNTINMNEFLKLNWRVENLANFETQNCFITEEVVTDSLIYKFCQKKRILQSTQGKKRYEIFEKHYIPGGKFSLCTTIKSSLDAFAHQHCLKALKLFQSGKNHQYFNFSEQFAVEMFQKLKPRIIEENTRYESFVLKKWNLSDKKKIERLKVSVYLFGKKNWEKKWKAIYFYPQYFKEIKTFSMTFNENESIIDFKCVNNVLELGTLARFSNPNLKSACCLKGTTLPLLESSQGTFSKLPVSQDKNINEILQNCDIDLVISASGLKCITDNSDLKSKWIIPFSVKTVTIRRENGSLFVKKVVFVDKPFSQNHVSNLDIAQMSYKRIIKTNLCQLEAFKFKDDELIVKPEDLENNSCFLDSHSDIGNKDRKIHHNVSYRIWNIKKTDCQNTLMKNKSKTVEFNVLIRSKLDACERNEEGFLQPVVIKPKLETQLNYGAKVPSKSELAREWTSLFFIPFSNLYRVRLSPVSGEIICVDKCNIQKIVAEAQTHYDYKPQYGLGILQRVFEELINLKNGNYLLQHLPKHEVFVAVLQESQSSPADDSEIYNFHEEHNDIKLEPIPKHWLPIDVNYILPSFDAANRLPGMFTPRQKLKASYKNKRQYHKKTKQTQ